MGGCCSSFSEKYDDWSIVSEIRPGERGAGILFKKGKGFDVWSKRYFTLTNSKLIYYTEKDRAVARGEIVLAGAVARVSSSRISTAKEFHFSITHPECGTRELYATSNNRRKQWLLKINEVATELSSISCYGKLLKQGGLNKNIWQERWCVLAGRVFDYFENPTDNQIKGTIDIYNCTLREFSAKDQKYCFEISSAVPGKKGSKKYVFAVQSEKDYDKWIEVLKKNRGLSNEESASMTPSFNPLQPGKSEEEFEDTVSDAVAPVVVKSTPTPSPPAPQPPAPVKQELNRNASVSTTKPLTELASVPPKPESLSRQSSMATVKSFSEASPPVDITRKSTDSSISDNSRQSALDKHLSLKSVRVSTSPPDKSGYLDKLSPNRFAGWQKRYIVIKAPGILLYYGSENDFKSGGNPKGDISFNDVLPGSKGVKLIEGKNEIAIQVDNRTYSFRAESAELAKEWVDAIKAWLAFTNDI